MRKRYLLLIGFLPLLAGCAAAAKAIAGVGACSYSFSGAASASGNCLATGVYSASINQSEIAIVNAGAPTSGVYLDGAGIKFPGAFADGTYVSGNLTSSTGGGITIQNNVGGNITEQWVATFNDSSSGNNVPDQGSYSGSVTSFTAAAAGGTFSIHGKITATLTPSPAAGNTATGTLNLTITY